VAGDFLFGREVRDERSEAFVLGNHVESGTRRLGRDVSNVISDVKIQGVPSCALDADVLGVRSEGLELVGEVERDLALVGPAKDFYLECPALKACQILRLNVFKVNEDEVRSRGPAAHLACDGTVVELQ
jgi:hypothetical protein